jgi:hypothetical protein
VGAVLGGHLPGAHPGRCGAQVKGGRFGADQDPSAGEHLDLAAFAASKPGRPRSPFEIELEAERAENACRRR